MKTFNIWIKDSKNVGPTGPWKYVDSVLAKDESSAKEAAKMRYGISLKYGLNGDFMVYEGA